MDGWVRREFHPHADGSFTINHVQDVEPVIEQNKRWQNEPQQKSELLGHHIASIPLVVWQKWGDEEGVNLFQLPKHELTKFLRKKLADPDNRFFKTR